jgi:hypothetical protein
VVDIEETLTETIEKTFWANFALIEVVLNEKFGMKESFSFLYPPDWPPMFHP